VSEYTSKGEEIENSVSSVGWSPTCDDELRIGNPLRKSTHSSSYMELQSNGQQ
jgi:hypothetical protein